MPQVNSVSMEARRLARALDAKQLTVYQLTEITGLSHIKIQGMLAGNVHIPKWLFILLAYVDRKTLLNPGDDLFPPADLVFP